MAIFEYIGPEYKAGIVINNRQMRPKDFTQEQIPMMIQRFPDLKNYFREKATAKAADNGVDKKA